MCATILKLANSAFFGMPRTVATMDKAVTVLGFNEVHNIVLGKAVFNSFLDLSFINKLAMDTFWNHSFTCGLAAKILAEDLNCCPSELFIAGLIHDIGKLALFHVRPEEYLEILEQTGKNHSHCKEMEIEKVGMDHEQVGIYLLTRWLFPDTLLSAVGFHHRPEENHTNPLYAAIIQISDILSLLASPKNEARDTPLLPQLLKNLPLGESIWQKNKININEKQLQKWMTSLYKSTEKDSGILNIFTS